jgi:peptidyl-prolyl cis-trans isomerase D
MIQFLSDKFRWILLASLAIVCISFIFWGSWTPRNDSSSQTIGKIRNHPISLQEFADDERATQIMYALRHGRLMDMQAYGNDFLFKQTWARLVALEAAKEAGMHVSDAEVIAFLKKNPLFQENNAYSPIRFQKFYQNVLAPAGISTSLFQDMVANELLIQQMLESISSTAVVQPSEVESSFKKLFGNTEMVKISFSTKALENTINPTPEEIQNFYSKHSEHYAVPEKRRVEYVEFNLAEKQRDLPDKDKTPLLTKLGQQAYDFTGQFAADHPKDFKTAATIARLPVIQTEYFDLNDPKLPDYLQTRLVLKTIFGLTRQKTISDYIMTSHGFVVFHLLDIKPEEATPLKDIEKQVREDVIRSEALQKLRLNAARVRTDIEMALRDGKTWDAIVKEMKLNVTNLPPFVLADTQNNSLSEDAAIRLLSQNLDEGDLSEFLQTRDGGMILYVKQRSEPPEEKRKELFDRVRRDVLEQRRTQLINQWLSAEIAKPGTVSPEDDVLKQ